MRRHRQRRHSDAASARRFRLAGGQHADRGRHHGAHGHCHAGQQRTQGGSDFVGHHCFQRGSQGPDQPEPQRDRRQPVDSGQQRWRKDLDGHLHAGGQPDPGRQRHRPGQGGSDGRCGQCRRRHHLIRQLCHRHPASYGRHCGCRRHAQGRTDIAGDHHLQRGSKRLHQHRPQRNGRQPVAGAIQRRRHHLDGYAHPTGNLDSANNAITPDNTGVQDAAGNTGAGSTVSNTYAVHTVRPTATITVVESALKIGQTSQVVTGMPARRSSLTAASTACRANASHSLEAMPRMMGPGSDMDRRLWSFRAPFERIETADFSPRMAHSMTSSDLPASHYMPISASGQGSPRAS